MKSDNKVLTMGVGEGNSQLLLEYNYEKLGRDVSRAVIECPAIISLLMQRDLSVLTNDKVLPGGLHMKACLRMTCALIGIKDPFPIRKNAG